MFVYGKYRFFGLLLLRTPLSIVLPSEDQSRQGTSSFLFLVFDRYFLARKKSFPHEKWSVVFYLASAFSLFSRLKTLTLQQNGPNKFCKCVTILFPPAIFAFSAESQREGILLFPLRLPNECVPFPFPDRERRRSSNNLVPSPSLSCVVPVCMWTTNNKMSFVKTVSFLF